MRDGESGIYYERWSPQHLHMKDAIVALLPFPAVRGEAGNFFITSPQHLLRRDGANNIYS